MLNSSGAEVVKSRLHVAVGDLHSLAGWTSFDVGMIDSAGDHFDRALELVRAGGSPELEALIRYRMGRVCLHLRSPADALTMLRLGRAAARRSGSAVAVAIICANAAWAHTLLGNAKRAARLIRRARKEFARAEHDKTAGWLHVVSTDDVPPSCHREADAPRRAFLRTMLGPSAAVGQRDA